MSGWFRSSSVTIRAKPSPVHRQSASGRDGGGVGAAEDQAAQSPQLLLQQAHGILQPRSP